MCILEKLNFKISGGSMPPDPPSVLAPSALVPSFAGPTMGNSHYNITYLNQTKIFFSFFHYKRVHLPYYKQNLNARLLQQHHFWADLMAIFRVAVLLFIKSKLEYYI